MWGGGAGGGGQGVDLDASLLTSAAAAPPPAEPGADRPGRPALSPGIYPNTTPISTPTIITPTRSRQYFSTHVKPAALGGSGGADAAARCCECNSDLNAASVPASTITPAAPQSEPGTTAQCILAVPLLRGRYGFLTAVEWGARIAAGSSGLSLLQERVEVDEMDSVDHGEAAHGVLNVAQDHEEELGRELPSVATQADGVEHERLQEFAEDWCRDQPQGSGEEAEEIESFHELHLVREGLDDDLVRGQRLDRRIRQRDSRLHATRHNEMRDLGPQVGPVALLLRRPCRGSSQAHVLGLTHHPVPLTERGLERRIGLVVSQLRIAHE